MRAQDVPVCPYPRAIDHWFQPAEIDRHPENRCRDTSSSSSSQKARPFLRSSYPPPERGITHDPSSKLASWWDHPIDRLDRRVGVGIAMKEVVRAVAAGIHARDEGRPGHRAQRRHAGLKWLEIAIGGEPFEVRHPVFGDELLEQPGIHTVDADDDDLLVVSRLGAHPRAATIAGTARQSTMAKTGSSCSSCYS